MSDSRFGTVGTPARVLVNAFRLKWSGASLVYHYTVSITPEWPIKSGATPTISKQKGIEILQRLQTRIHPSVFPRLGAFDGKSNLYSFIEYKFNGPSISFEHIPLDSDNEKKRPKTVKIVIALVRTVNIGLLRGLLEGHDDSSLRDDSSGATSCLNMLNMFVQAQPRRGANLYKGNSFYVPPSGSPGFDRDIDPLRLWSGFFQSVRPAINEIIVNVDVTAGVVMPSQPLVQAACSFVRCRDAHGLRDLPPHEFRKLRGALRGLKVAVSIKGQPRRRSRPIKDLVSNVGGIEFDGPDGLTTVAEHFFQKYKINLPKDTLGVKLGQGELFPITVCEVETQLYKPKLAPNQVSALHKFMPSNPMNRLKRITDGWEVLGHSQSEFLQASRVEIEDRPMSVEARILDPRTIAFGPRSEQDRSLDLVRLNPGNTGTWDIMRKRLVKPAKVQMMVVNYSGLRTTETMMNFVKDLCVVMKDRGMIITQASPILHGKAGDDINETLLAYGKQYLPNLILVLLPAEAEEIYTQIKRFGDVIRGIATQCIRWKDQLFDPGRGGKGGGGRKINWNQYHNNLILKINGKLGGINYHSFDPATRMLEDTNALVIGADVSHPAPGSAMPSIAALVSSIDLRATRYIASVKVQQSRTEIIQELEQMLDTALIAYFQSNRNIPPKSIYFFRDGVSEGEFERVRQAEFRMMKELTTKKYKELRVPPPKLTFIIVGKRHHFRFFPSDNKDADRSGNCRSGFVVDRRITHPIYRDFYLQSQAGLKGTSVPAHYTVLEDENLGFNANHLQELAYSLCHCYSRATRAVKIPAPVYYADLACRRAKFHYDPAMHESLSAHSGASEEIHLDFYKENFTPVNERMQKYMYFL